MTTPSLSTIKQYNEEYSPSYLPVALFIGGTSGIGKAMAEAFARYTNGNAHIIICGRNRTAGEAIIASFPKPTVMSSNTTGAIHEFVQCDVSLMKNVQGTSDELRSRLPRLNFLVISTGFLAMKGRDETEEGLDRKLACHYYSRFKFIRELMPLLRKAKDGGQDAKVMSVQSAGWGDKVHLDDIDLKKNYSFLGATDAVSVYNDLMIEQFAIRDPDISFTHIHPGFVLTPIFNSSRWYLRPIMPFILFLYYLTSSSPEKCAEYMWRGLFAIGSGAHRLGEKGEDIGKTNDHGGVYVQEKVWEFTEKVTTVKTA